MFRKYFLPGLRVLALMTFLTGFVYPLVVTAAAQLLFPYQANGSLVVTDGQVIGSELIGQANADPADFWPRPSAVDYNPLPSGAANLGPTSAVLWGQVQERAAALQAPVLADLPADLLFASGSGLDPHISPQAASLQIPRLARERGLDPARLQALVDQFTEAPQWGLFGSPRVNVLMLNMALDALE